MGTETGLRGEWVQGGEAMQIKQNREHRKGVGIIEDT